MATDNQQTRQITTHFSLDAHSAQSHTFRSHQLNEVNRSETMDSTATVEWEPCQQQTGNTSERMLEASINENSDNG